MPTDQRTPVDGRPFYCADCGLKQTMRDGISTRRWDEAVHLVARIETVTS